MVIDAAMIKPEFTALIPSREAFTTLNCFSCSQNLMVKNIKNVPGKNMAIPETIPPIV